MNKSNFLQSQKIRVCSQKARVCTAGFVLPAIIYAVLAPGVVACSPQLQTAPQNEAAKMDTAPQKKNAAQPNPNLSPEQVITIVLEALQRNDEQAPDSGIATAFRFASPGNRAATGPLERFIQLVKSPAYKPLLNHKTAARGAVRIADDIARQRVTLTAANGERIVYLFTVSKQTEDPYKNCWMTDGVERLKDNQEDGQQVAKSNGKLSSPIFIEVTQLRSIVIKKRNESAESK